jgi:hypothetical protein
MTLDPLLPGKLINAVGAHQDHAGARIDQRAGYTPCTLPPTPVSQLDDYHDL